VTCSQGGSIEFVASGCHELFDDFDGKQGVEGWLRFKIFKQDLVQPTNPAGKRISQAEMP
jgi:hypothetical protein